jgi:hypothetical protein
MSARGCEEGAMRTRHLLIGTLALAVVVATIGGVAFALHARTQAPADGHTSTQGDAASYPGWHAPVFIVCPAPPYGTISQGPLQGLPYRPSQVPPAIRPRNDCTPSFTQRDVRDYVAHRQQFSDGVDTITGQPAVTRVLFLTLGDFVLFTRPFGGGLEENYPPDMLVCYVGLSGTLTIVGPFHPRYPTQSISTASIVFDAHTGQMIYMFPDALLS